MIKCLNVKTHASETTLENDDTEDCGVEEADEGVGPVLDVFPEAYPYPGCKNLEPSDWNPPLKPPLTKDHPLDGSLSVSSEVAFLAELLRLRL